MCNWLSLSIYVDSLLKNRIISFSFFCLFVEEHGLLAAVDAPALLLILERLGTEVCRNSLLFMIPRNLLAFPTSAAVAASDDDTFHSLAVGICLLLPLVAALFFPSRIEKSLGKIDFYRLSSCWNRETPPASGRLESGDQFGTSFGTLKVRKWCKTCKKLSADGIECYDDDETVLFGCCSFRLSFLFRLTALSRVVQGWALTVEAVILFWNAL